jgi:hypothetical protein
LIITGCLSSKGGEGLQLFNGRTLEGWEGDVNIFRISDNSIVGGNSKDSIDRNYYLCSKQNFKNFELSFEVKFYSDDIYSNSGVCFRSYWTEDGLEVAGYQADIGYMPLWWVPLISHYDTTNMSDPYPLWGALLDENRKDSTLYPNPQIFPVIILGLADDKLVEQQLVPKDWNMMRIIANNDDIEIRINGKSLLKFREDRLETSEGSICLQVHSGGPTEVGFRNIRIKEI